MPAAVRIARQAEDTPAVLPQERGRAGVLYRISDGRQQSVPTQRAWAERVARRDGLAIAGEFEEEGVSGADVNRPGLDELLALAREQFYARRPLTHLLIIDLDRFGRRDSLSTSGWLDKLRTFGLRYIITAEQRFDLRNPLDRTLIALSSDFTREPELRAKSNHVLNGMAERARKGYWLGGPVPLGYRTEFVPGTSAGDRKRPKVLVLGPEKEQETVRWIFREYASGRLTANGIARALNARGVRPARSKGGRWSRNTVLKMLASRTYLGCVVWGDQQSGRYHRLEKSMVVPREDKEDREQAQLLRRLKRLPVALAGDEDCVVCPDAHPALIDRETFDACQRRRADNRDNFSAGRENRSGVKGQVWPLAGQLKCGHCGEPVWTLPVADGRGKRLGSYRERARVCCCERRKDPSACPRSAAAPYLDVLNRVVGLLQTKLAEPGAVEEMARECERQQQEQDRAGKGDRKRLEARVRELDGKVAEAVANLAHTPADLRDDVAEYVRGLKGEREAAGQQLRDLDAREAGPRVDPADFRATLEMVQGLTTAMETTEEAELLRATLRDPVAEVRLHFRARRDGDPRPRRGVAPARVIGRVEVDLTPAFAGLLTDCRRPAPCGKP
jgi:DNA invertase Pin-like site-specific DNA recombinase